MKHLGKQFSLNEQDSSERDDNTGELRLLRIIVNIFMYNYV